MSIKATKFQELLGNPMNTFNFMVVITDPSDNLNKVQILVNSTTFPSEELQEFTCHFMGERVKFPSIPTNNGVWNCSVVEAEAAKVFDAFVGHYSKVYNQKTGQLSHISMYDKFTVDIYGCGLNGDISEGGDNQKKVGVRLHGAFLKGKGDVQLDNSNATGVWMWNFAFSYDWIEDIQPDNRGTRKSAFTDNTNP